MLKNYQTYLMYVGGQRYIGHTELTLKQRMATHRSDAKKMRSDCKMHVALRAANYQCTISRIEGGMYETLDEARENENLWILNYDTINNGLNSCRAILTKAETLKRCREYQQKNKERIYAHRRIKVTCWNCDAVIRGGNISTHRKGVKCSAIKMNSLKLIKMYL
jgi:hypothetical protein